MRYKRWGDLGLTWLEELKELGEVNCWIHMFLGGYPKSYTILIHLFASFVSAAVSCDDTHSVRMTQMLNFEAFDPRLLRSIRWFSQKSTAQKPTCSEMARTVKCRFRVSASHERERQRTRSAVRGWVNLAQIRRGSTISVYRTAQPLLWVLHIVIIRSSCRIIFNSALIFTLKTYQGQVIQAKKNCRNQPQELVDKNQKYETNYIYHVTKQDNTVKIHPYNTGLHYLQYMEIFHTSH